MFGLFDKNRPVLALPVRFVKWRLILYFYFKLITGWLCIVALVSSLIYAIAVGGPEGWIFLIGWFILFDGGGMTVNAIKTIIYMLFREKN